MSNFVNAVDDGYGGIMYTIKPLGIVAIVVIALVLVLLGCILFGKNKKFAVRPIAFSGVAIALGVVASMLKLWKMPMGGSVTLFSMLFIVLIGYWYGFGTGIMAALAYGVLQLLIDPYIISFPQMLLDYIFAFTALGLSGLFSKSKHGLIKGYLLGVFGRFVVATISGVVFFATYAPEFFNNPWAYSACYNGAYIGLEAVITLVILVLPPVNKGLSYVKQLATK